MMFDLMDFTLSKYRQLLEAVKASNFSVTLRHDVDLRPDRSLQTALLEHEMGLHAVYYFRAVPESWDEEIILRIRDLGHEIGYHYESLTTCNGDVDAAYQDFCHNLDRLSRLIGRPVKSICMHGSPKSPYDSKDIWKKYDYHALGVEHEPYLDTDFSNTFYLTDTGRRWDGFKVSVRDKVPIFQDQWAGQGLVYHSTNQVIAALLDPNSSLRQTHTSIMITTHPQRWMPFGLGWIAELLLQNTKNIIKSFLVKRSSRRV